LPEILLSSARGGDPEMAEKTARYKKTKKITKSERLIIRFSPPVREILTRAAHADHRPLGNYLVHAGLIYAKGILGEEYKEVADVEE
jgi:uncharacterized protein (DUF1778 family)